MSSGRAKSFVASALSLTKSARWRLNPLSDSPSIPAAAPTPTAATVNPAYQVHGDESKKNAESVTSPAGSFFDMPNVTTVEDDGADDDVAEEMDDSVKIPVRMTPLEVEAGEKAGAAATTRKPRTSTYRKANSNTNLFRTPAGAGPPLLASATNPALVSSNPLNLAKRNTKVASPMDNGERKGIPVREGLQAVYKVYRDRNIMEGFFFVLMFAFFILNVNIVNDVTVEYHAGAAIQNHLVDEDMNVFASWEKTFDDLWTHADVFEWFFNVLYPGVYLNDFPGTWTQNTPIGTPLVQAWDVPPDPNASIPIVLGNFLAVGGIRLRQTRVTRDSCIERRTVGRYYVPTSIFSPAALNLPGARQNNVGTQGTSMLNSYFAAQPAVPAEGITQNTGVFADGGASASIDASYAFGCMNYWALTGVCPSDIDAAKMAAPTVMINTAPVSNVSASRAASRVPVTVSVSGRMKCAMHNITASMANIVYNMFNPLQNVGYNGSVIIDPTNANYVMACLGRFDTLDGSCSPSFDETTQQTVPFVGATGTVYTYSSSASNDNLASMLGWGPSSGYGTGGYVVHLSNDADYAAATLARLYWDHWIDRQTRAVTADINLWNANTRMASTFRTVFEFMPSGYMTKYIRIYTYRVLDHDAATNFLTYLISVLFVLCWLYFWFIEFQRLRYSFNIWAYVTSFRNLYVCTLLVLAGVYIWSWVDYVFVVDMYTRVVNNFAVKSYVDLFDVAEKYQTMFTLSGLLGLLFFFKLFEYLGMNKRMRTIWFTLFEARIELLAFLLGFMLLVYGFSFAGQFIFGYSSMGFHNSGAAMSTLLRFPLGDFDYNSALYDTRPALAPWFFVAFLAMIFLVSLNIAIAILTTSFDKVHEATKSVDRWKESATSIDEDLLYLLRVKLKVWSRPTRRWCKKRCSRAKQGRPSTPTSTGTESPPSGTPGATPVIIDTGATVVNPIGPTAESNPARASDAGANLRSLGRKSMFDMKSRRSILNFFNSNLAADGNAELARTEEDETEREYGAYHDAAKFYAMIHKCTDSAKVNNNIDLFAYIKRLYENERDSDKLCIGEDELCELTSKKACGRHNHKDNNCLAYQACETFYKLKTVLTTGNAMEHTTPWEAMTRANRTGYKLIKINKMGKVQGRIFFIALSTKSEVDGVTDESGEGLSSAVDREGGVDPEGCPVEAVLYNFDERHRLKKKLPLRQLVQLEKSTRDLKRLTLVFSSQGGSQLFMQDDEDGAGLETTYHLLFASEAEKHKFETDIVAAHHRSMQTVDAEQSLDDFEAMTSKKTAARSRTRASTKGSQTSAQLQESLRRKASRQTLNSNGSSNDSKSMWKTAVRGITSVNSFVGKPVGLGQPPEPSLPHAASAGSNLFTGLAETPVSSFYSDSLQRAEAVAASIAPGPVRTRGEPRSASPAVQQQSFFGGASPAQSPAPSTRPSLFQ